jgi:putative DNA primase/helicase
MPYNAPRGGLTVAVAVPSSLTLAAALDYAARGWRVFPCKPAGKLPLTKNGFKDATADAGAIATWWHANANANVAIATGAGLVVLDVDGDDGRASLLALEELHGALPQTLRAATGGNGEHLFFVVPAGVEIRNSASKLGKGLDVRGDGGYVIAAPSVHESGRLYTWTHEDDPAPLPSWLLERLVKKPASSAPRPAPIAWSGEISKYAQAALEGEVEEVLRAPEGTRNPTLNTAAFKLGQLIAGGELGEQLVRDRLYDAARSVGLDERETLKTIDSGIAAGAKQPRRAPEASAPNANGNGHRPRLALVEPQHSEDPHLTDTGNAKRLVDRHGEGLRYCHPWNTWLAWDGMRWRRDDNGEVMRRAIDTVLGFGRAAWEIEDSADRRKNVQWALTSENGPRLREMTRLASDHTKVIVAPDELDADQFALNVQNGTINLRTGQLQPHDRAKLLTKLAPVEYDAAAECPTWMTFLEQVFDSKTELIEFVQRAIGYSLTGSISEQVLFIAFGSGSNGKSTLLETLRALLGDYAQQTPTETLLERRTEGIPNDLARLPGARLVSAAETGEGRRLNESLIKLATGGEPITARFLRAEWFEFHPIFKLWLATNHRPVIRGTDEGIWRRIRLIPFEVSFRGAAQDKTLPARLREELPGILRWAVDGCLAWQRDGLGLPDEVRLATNDYREQMDVLLGFIDDCCALDNPAATTRSSELYKAYAEWCDANGERATSHIGFGRALRERGFAQTTVGHSKHKAWTGIGLLSALEGQLQV